MKNNGRIKFAVNMLALTLVVVTIIIISVSLYILSNFHD